MDGLLLFIGVCILNSLRQLVEYYFSQGLTKPLLTIPDYVSEVQREKVLFNIILPNGISFVPISRKYCETIKEKFLIHHLKLERKFL